MNKISVSELNKSYHDRAVLRQVSFEACAGTVTTLLGNSGAGKSTVFRLLSGLDLPDSGQIDLQGKKIGLIFQQFHLWKHMTVLENCILAPVHVQKLPKSLASQKAEKLLGQLGIGHKLHDNPSTLSGGEQQRVAIVRALMMDPDILLFDEPTSSLDPERTEIVANMIQSLTKKQMIVLVITHDIQFATRISDQILFFDKGRLIETADCKKGIIHKKSERLSEFLKCVNQ